MNLSLLPFSTASEKFLRMAFSRIPGKLTVNNAIQYPTDTNTTLWPLWASSPGFLIIFFPLVRYNITLEISFQHLSSHIWDPFFSFYFLSHFFSTNGAVNELLLLCISTSQEPGFLLPLVTVNAVCDLEGCYSSQGIQDFWSGPARKSQIMNSLQKKKKNTYRYIYA